MSATSNTRTPMEKRALALAEATLELGFRLRHQSNQIPGLARILTQFAENEIRLIRRDNPDPILAPDPHTETPVKDLG